MMNEIFEISGIESLRIYLAGIPDKDALREQLYALFLKYAQYRNAAEWNLAVRICEALAIIGWGAYEPLEAVRGVWFNGNPETYFLNRDSKPRFLDAVWSKRKEGLAIDFGLSFFHGSRENPSTKPLRQHKTIGEPQDMRLCSQRNWIPKNPIRFIRGISNCYENSRRVIESMEKALIPELNRCMRPELYGTDINYIVLNMSFSFFDNPHCKTNYIIAEESLKLKRKDFYPKLLEMYTEKEIEDNGYYLRNRFTYGPFRKDTGCVRVDIVFEKEFSQMSECDQKRLLGEYLIHAVEQVAKRLGRKISYDFNLMIYDFKTILKSWY